VALVAEVAAAGVDGAPKVNGFGVSVAVAVAAAAPVLLGDAGVKLNVAGVPFETEDDAAAKLTAGVDEAAGVPNLNATDGC
jgi:hypothetical protein